MSRLRSTSSHTSGIVLPEVASSNPRARRGSWVFWWAVRALACASFGVSAYFGLSLETRTESQLTLRVSASASATFKSRAAHTARAAAWPSARAETGLAVAEGRPERRPRPDPAGFQPVGPPWGASR